MLWSFIGLIDLGICEDAEHIGCPDGSVFHSPRLCFWSRRGTPCAQLPPWKSLTARWICGPWGDWGKLCSSAICISWPSITASKAEGGAVAGWALDGDSWRMGEGGGPHTQVLEPPQDKKENPPPPGPK